MPSIPALVGASLLMAATLPAVQPALAATTAAAADKLAANPLIGEWNTPDGVPPYDKIRPEHYEPAVDEGIRQALRQVQVITMQRSMPTFENTVEALEKSGELLNRTLNTCLLYTSRCV